MTTFHQQLSANIVGRDFIVGDLHGCLDLLQIELERVRFDPRCDRLFSVGDLADRGPDPMGCFRLLREPWFHAVVGNHEDMLLAYFQQRDSNYHSATDLLENGGIWILDLSASERSELIDDLLPKILALPYVITVGMTGSGFHVAHAEMLSGNLLGTDSQAPLPAKLKQPDRVLTDTEVTDTVLQEMTTPLTWGRRLVSQVNVEQSRQVQTPYGALLLSQQPWAPGLSLTYVGHTPLTKMVLHASHLFIDAGAYGRKPSTRLLMVQHAQFLAWFTQSHP